MKQLLVIVAICTACARQPTLPASSQHNVISMLNDSTWFATGKAIRLVESGKKPNTIKQFNLQIITDINFPGNSSATRSPKITGCNGDCIPTQRLHIYNIPLKKGTFKLGRLDKRRTVEQERANYWLMINGSGIMKNYTFEGSKPGWIRITHYDRQLNTLEGRFSFNLDENLSQYGRLINSIPPVAAFREGLFRVRLEDVRIKKQ